MYFERSGDWFFWGCLASVFITEGLHIKAGWVVIVALVGGWMLNEKRRKDMEARAEQDARRRDAGLFPYDRLSE